MNSTKELEPPMQTYEREDVLKSCIEYFGGDELSADVWINKYALKDSDGNIYENTPADMHARIASEIARIEKKYPNSMSEALIFELLDKFKHIIPAGSSMSGIGNNFQTVSLSNCFVIGHNGPSDSYGAICRTDEEQVQLMKRRGGVGHTLEAIRPKGSQVKNSALTSTGVVPFMERYSSSTREVAQDGRRGALMLSMAIKHPDSEDFIDAKMDGTKVTGANVSVKIDDEFMRSVHGNGKYTQQWPVDSENPEFTKEVNSKKIWDKIIHNAWKSAEPGVLFWDKIISESIPDRYADLGYKTVSTNPCGEIPLCPDDSCRLLSINLYSYVDNPFTPEATFNYEKFNKHSGYGLRIMDAIVDLEIEKVERILDKLQSDPESASVKRTEIELWTRIKQKCIDGRRTGIGITAEGDMLAAMGFTYGTKKATEFAEHIHQTYAIAVYRESNNLAKERGAFPIWDPKREEDAPMLLRIKDIDPQLYHDLMKYGRRNIALLTIAPNGTVSLMAQTSSGIEPVFMVAYKRRKKVNPNDKNSNATFVDDVGDHWEEYNVYHHAFKTWLEITGHKYLSPAKKNIPFEQLDDETVAMLITKSPYNKALANDVDWVEKVRMQGKIQKWIDHSISVTVNLPEHVTEELVNKVYRTAWKEGCKGCTIYRDGSRSGVLVSKDDKQKEIESIFRESHAPKRPKALPTSVLTFMNKGERWIGLIGELDGKPYEIFTGQLDNFPIPTYVEDGIVQRTKGEDGKSNYDFIYSDKNGNDIKIPSLNHAFDDKYYDMAKTISALLRHGMPITYVVEFLDGLNLDGDLITTWKAGVKRMLKKYIKDGVAEEGKSCNECGSESLEYKEGCLTCMSCGNSKCG